MNLMKSSFHKTCLLGLLFLLSLPLFAGHVPAELAKTVGKNFLEQKSFSSSHKSNLSLELVYSEGEQESNHKSNGENTTYFYVFTTSTQGFVIVSGDDRVIPVIGYSENDSFDPDNIPYNCRKWLEGCRSQIRYVMDNNILTTDEIERQWSDFTTGVRRPTQKAVVVAPLITTKWNQSPYYNLLCPPYSTNSNNNAVTGCVATAMAQVMKYWNYPAQGTGYHSYSHSTYGTVSANFASTSYQWSNMPIRLNASSTQAQDNAVATLMYHCGVSVDMNYGTSASGAYVISSASPKTHCAEYAFKTYFGYKNTLQGISRSYYTTTNWINKLKTELNANRPIVYAGYGTAGGHCFVCDGYDDDNYFHFNWGWNGTSDGYFLVDALNPSALGTGGGAGGFNDGQQIIIGLEPPAGTVAPDDIALNSNLNLSSASIPYGNSFSLSVDVGNFGNNSFTGSFVAAIFDESNAFIDYVSDPVNKTIPSGYAASLTFNNPGAFALLPGNYKISILYKSASATNWSQVGDYSSYFNVAALSVYCSADIEMYSDFTLPNEIVEGESAAFSVRIANFSQTTTFFGSYYVGLCDMNGVFAQIIDTVETGSTGLPPNNAYTNPFIFSTNAITAEPGTYLLVLAYKRQGSTGIYVAGSSSGYTNPIKVIVKAPSIQKDMYEPNDTIITAYNLPVSFSGNTAVVNTTGSTLHGGDKDFYKVTLPAGYNYTVTARLHDSYSSGNGQEYTVDARFCYSTKGGSTWSSSIDDIMTGNSIQLDSGGTVHFWVSPYYPGSTGTYLLSINITRAGGINPDVYEVNDAIATSYNLPVSFSGNTATVNTTGSNFHVLTDQDFYKINLPAGYNYTLTSRLHDSYNSENGQAYTANAKFSFSIDDGANWSEFIDDVMLNKIQLNGGGTVHYRVIPYATAGEIGTYLLTINIIRAAGNGIENTDEEQTVILYPNPAKDVVYISLTDRVPEINAVTLFDVNGKQIFTQKVVKSGSIIELSLPEIPTGTYLLQMQSPQGIINKKVIVQK